MKTLVCRGARSVVPSRCRATESGAANEAVSIRVCEWVGSARPLPLNRCAGRNVMAGFTIAEVVVSMAIAALAFSGIIYGYVSASQRAEWSSYSLAAQSLAMQRMEQTRAAKWDPLGYPPVENEFHQSRYPMTIEILDIPIAGTNIVYATNFTTIRDVPGPSPLRMVRVDCVWSFLGRGPFTNAVATLRSPDQ